MGGVTCRRVFSLLVYCPVARLSWALKHLMTTVARPDFWVCIALFHQYVKRDVTAQDTSGPTLNPCSHEKEGYFVKILLLPDRGV